MCGVAQWKIADLTQKNYVSFFPLRIRRFEIFIGHLVRRSPECPVFNIQYPLKPEPEACFLIQLPDFYGRRVQPPDTTFLQQPHK